MMLKTMTVILPVMLLLTWPITHAAVAESGEDDTVQVQVNTTKDDASINSTIVIRENDEELRVVRRNGDLRVQINGEDIPEERVRFARGRLVILDDDGSELRTMRLLPGGTVVFEGDPVGGPQPPQLPRVLQRGPGGGGGPSGPGAGPTGLRPGGGGPGGPGAGPSGPWVSPPGPPRGQIGIGLGRINAALAGHLQLDPDEVVLITNVRDGAPAAQAGLQQHDIIIELEGESPVTHGRISRAVREKEPGEQLALTVLRAGDKHQINVEIGLVERRGPGGFGGSAGPAGRRPVVRELRNLDPRWAAATLEEVLGGDQRRFQRRLREMFSEEQLESFRQHLLEDIERSFELDGYGREVREKARHMAERAAARVREHIERLAEEYDFPSRILERLELELELDQPPRIELERVPGGIEFFRNEDGTLKGVFMRPPDTPQPPRRPADIGRLTERLDQLERMLERIEQKLDRLAEQR